MWVWLISIDPGTWLYAEWLHITPVMEGKGISFCHDCFLSVKIRRRTYTLQRATREDMGKMSRSFLIGWQWLAAQRTPGQFSESCTKTREKWGYHPLETAVVILTHKSQNSRWHTIILVNTVHQIQDKHVHISFFFSHIDRWKKKICYQGRMHWQGHRWDQAAGSAALRLAAFLLFEMKINFNISLA